MRRNRKPLLKYAAIGILVAIVAFLLWPAKDTDRDRVEVSTHEVPDDTQEIVSGVNSAPPDRSTQTFVPGELLVRFAPDAAESEIEAAVGSLGATVKKRFARSGSLYLLSLPNGVSVEAARSALQSVDIVDVSEPNYIYRAAEIVDDPLFSSKWGLHNIGQAGGIDDIDINAPEAWQRSTGSRDFVIGVIDTGVAYYHHDLNANIWRNPGEIPANGLDDDQNGYVDDYFGIDPANTDTDPLDDEGHGTHVAGIIAAAGNNGIDSVGVMWSASVAPCKFLNEIGEGNTAGAVECLDYFLSLKASGVNVVATNNSWGGGEMSQILQDKIAEHDANDILFVAAAGNNGLNVDAFPHYAHYPSSYDNGNIIAVAAMDRRGDLASFSNWGAQSIDIVAPGVGIASTALGHGTTTASGTSMAAPFIAGVVGLLKANDPGLSGDEIKQHILSTGTVVPAFQSLTVSGMRLRADLPIVDNDGDGMPDRWESENGLDPGNPADAGLDPDGDGLSNLQEFERLTDPQVADTDGDGLSDGDEVNTHLTDPTVVDSDGDGLSDSQEVNTTGTDPNLADTDGDGLSDGDELNLHGTDPLATDSDGDGLDDGWELEFGLDPTQAGSELGDADNDGLTNGEEYGLGTDPTQVDSDEDGLSDIDERDVHGTDPTSSDTDGDGMLDGWEDRHGFDPLDAGDADIDADVDGFSNRREHDAGTDPNDPQSVPPIQPWSSLQGGAQRLGYIPVATANAQFRMLWEVRDETDADSFVASSGEGIFLVDLGARPDELVSRNPYTGKELWRRVVPGGAFLGAPQVADARISIEASDGDSNRFALLDEASGELIADYAIEGDQTRRGRFALDENSIVTADVDSLIRLDRATGDIVWQTSVGSGNLNLDYPTSDDEHVLLFRNNALDVYSYATGELLRRTSQSQCTETGDDKLVSLDDDNRAYVLHDFCMTAFNVVTGELLWEQPNISRLHHSVGADAIYVGQGGLLTALDKMTGQAIWTWDGDPAGNTSNLVSSDDHVFVGTSAGVTAIDIATRQAVWSSGMGGTLALSEDGILTIRSHFSDVLIAFDVSSDSDGDGMTDAYERRFGLNYLDSGDRDSDLDSDGLTNFEEYGLRSNPSQIDSDADGLSDADEVNSHLTAPSVVDTDGDGVPDGDEIFVHGTHPLSTDSDGDGFSDWQEVNEFESDPTDPSSIGPGLRTYLASFESGLPAEWSVPDDVVAGWVVSENDATDGFSGLEANGAFVTIELEQEFAKGDLLFDFRGEADECCHYLAVSIDGKPYGQFSAAEWASFRVAVPQGLHTIRFAYSDHSFNLAPRAFLDNVRFVAARPFAAADQNVLARVEDRLIEVGPDGQLIRGSIRVSDGFAGYNFVLTQQHTVVVTGERDRFSVFDSATESVRSATVSGPSNPVYAAFDDRVVVGGRRGDSVEGLFVYDAFGNFRERVLLSHAYKDLHAGEDGVLYALREDGYFVDRLSTDDFSLISTIQIQRGDSILASPSGTLYTVNAGAIQLHNSDGSVAVTLWSPNGTIHNASLADNGDVVYSVGELRIGRATADLVSTQEFEVGPLGTIYDVLRVRAASRKGVDTDADQLPDWWERGHMLDEHSAADAGIDSDGDTLTNLEEFAAGTHPGLADTDGDGLSDSDEIGLHSTDPVAIDSDDDGLSDYDEVATYGSDPLQVDTDGDSLTDREEAELLGSNPLATDTDGDGMPDAWEVESGLDLLSAGDAGLDPDSDGLTNLEEFAAGSDIGLADTDGDTLTDGDEVNVHFTDPASADTDDDFINDDWELLHALAPLSALDAFDDPDGDGHGNVDEYYAGTDPTDGQSFAAPEAWSTDQGNALHSGYVPLVTNPAMFARAWEGPLVGPNPTDIKPVAAVDGTLFAVASDADGDFYLLSVDGRSGTDNWRVALTGASWATAPAFANEKIYVSVRGDTAAAELQRYDADTGDLLGSTSYTGDTYGAGRATPYGSEVFIPIRQDSRSAMASIDGDSGAIKWTYQTLSQSPVSANDAHVFLYYEGNFEGLNRSDGSLAFTIPDTHFRTNARAPIADRFGNVFVWADGFIGRFVPSEQVKVWELSRLDGDRSFGDAMAFAAGVLYTHVVGELQALDSRDGTELWRWSVPEFLPSIQDSAVVTQSHAFVSTGSNTYAINLRTQMLDWSYPRGGVLAIDNSRFLYIVGGGPNGRQVTAIDLRGDTDTDGLPDDWEDANGLDKSDPADAGQDLDGDGLTNLEEYEAGTNPTAVDSDGDMLTDGEEQNTHGTDPAKADTDGDGLDDGVEVNDGLDPNNPDTDGDIMPDGWERDNGLDATDSSDASGDIDDDGLNNAGEYQRGTDPQNADSDDDGIEDGQEVQDGLDPANSDTDGDGMPDGWEVDNDLNPHGNDANEDPDGDGSTNLQEYQAGTDPQVAPTPPPPPPPPQPSGGGGGSPGPWMLLALIAIALRHTPSQAITRSMRGS